MREENQFTVMDPFDELDLSSDEIFDFYSPESPKQTLISKRRWAFNFFHADQQETRFLWKHKPTEAYHFKLIWMNADLCPKDKVVTWNLPFRSDTSYLVQSTT
ncbi:hypothetical protein YC2023_060177 [Brassica napus]